MIEKLIKQKIEVMKHPHHSEKAQNAVGAAAKPAPRGNRRSFSRKSKPKNNNSRKPNNSNKSRTNNSNNKPRRRF